MILVLEGEGAVNSIRQGTAQELLVQVTDQDNRPLAGASVTFILPASGPSATFVDGSRMVTLITDDKGQARVVAMRPNSLTGKFEIRVTASYQGQMARAVITQTNALEAPAAPAQPAAKKRGGSGKVIAILVAAVGGGVVAAMGAKGGGKGGGGSTATAQPSTPTVTVITLGPGSVVRP
jgi:hypothetical protein